MISEAKVTDITYDTMGTRRVDINTAGVDELATLLGVGRAKAEAIVEKRQTIEGFRSVDDLTTVPGLGRSIVDLNRYKLTCGNFIVQVEPSNPPPAVTHRHHGTPSTTSINLRNSSLATTPSSLTRRRETRRLPSSSASVDGGNKEGVQQPPPALNVAPPHQSPRSSRSSASSSPASGSSNSSSNEAKTNKRKCDGNSISPGKKTCRTLDLHHSLHHSLSVASCSTVHTFGAIRSNLHTTGDMPRRRLSSRVLPPSNLNEWLKTFQTWGPAEKRIALDELIDRCEPTQVRHVMSVIEPQFQRDFISLLPRELALYVLSFLEPRDLLRAAQTCHYWRILCEDNLLWKEKCREAGIDEVNGKQTRRRSHSGVPRSPWKSMFIRQHHIEYNWRFGEIRPHKVLKGHDDHVITCLQFNGQRIVSGSDDNTLKVWSATTGKCLRTLIGHTGGVWSSQMSNNIIISGSTDRTLKVWNADTGQCIHTLYGHTSTVRCMHLNNSKVVSGSRDATLRVWDIDTGQCLHVLMGHVAAVRCVQYDGRRVVSGAYDYTVKVWNPETEECLHTLQGHTNRVYSLQFDGTHIVSGSLDTSIRVWDAESGELKHTLMGHQSLTSGMELKDNVLVSGNADSTVKIWDITTGQCLQTLQGPNKHQSAVTCLQFNKKFVVTSSDDGTVKLWDLHTGEFIRNLVTLDSGGSGGVVWRVRKNQTKLVCAVGSRNGTEETKLLVLDFEIDPTNKV